MHTIHDKRTNQQTTKKSARKEANEKWTYRVSINQGSSHLVACCTILSQKKGAKRVKKNTDGFHLESIVQQLIHVDSRRENPSCLWMWILRHLCTTCDIGSVWRFCPWARMLYRGRYERQRRHHHVAKCFSVLLKEKWIIRAPQSPRHL